MHDLKQELFAKLSILVGNMNLNRCKIGNVVRNEWMWAEYIESSVFL